MKTLSQWFQEYGESHRHPANVALHKVCVPAIQWSLLLMLYSVKMGPLNLAWIAFAGALIFYLRVDLRAAVFQAVVALAMIGSAAVLERQGVILLPFGAVVFVVAWIGQFIGHRIEGRQPSFLQDLQFLLIGPLWIAKGLFRQ